jgi:MFS family permease
MAAFIMIREPAGLAVAEQVTAGQQFRRALKLWGINRAFRHYLAVHLTLALASIALPFYVIYAKNVLNAPAGMVGVYMAVRVGAQLLFTLPWGRMSDQRGNRLVLRLAILLRAGMLLLALVLVSLVGWLRPQGDWLPYLALPLFFLDGAVLPTAPLVGSNFLLELAPDAERPLYLGFANTLVGLLVLLSGLLGGLMVDGVGFGGLFLLTLGLCLLALGWTVGLPEPRGAH